MAAATTDTIATVNISGRITTRVRPIMAIICPTTALTGPAKATIGRITATIRITVIISTSTSSTDVLAARALVTSVAARLHEQLASFALSPRGGLRTLDLLATPRDCVDLYKS